MSALVTLIALLIIGAILFVSISAKTLAAILTKAFPIALIACGVALILIKQAALGSMMLFAGVTLWRRFRGVGSFGAKTSGPNVSSVRSAALEMELDHASGSMNGMVIVGSFEGRELDDMQREELFQLRKEIVDDGESLALLDAYLDRRLAGWREDAELDTGSGQGASPSSGPMGEKEAYEVLGLSAGATGAQVRQAHRRLMKAAHPDSGGSTFLAAKINEAKDVLLRSHS